LIALAKGRKWNLRRVRDKMVVREPIRCDLPKLKHPMMVEMTKVEMTKAEMTKVEMTKAEMTKAEVRTRSRHRTTHVQGFITLNPKYQNTASSYPQTLLT
jgi:hypothetical protein